MNLADIRKKAKLERQSSAEQSAPEASVVAIAGKEMPSPAPTVPVSPVVPLAAEPQSLAVMAEVKSGSSTETFDPLSLLLAGRATAGCDEEVPADDSGGAEAEVGDFREFLCFRVSDEFYAISIMEIKEIIKPREITEVPRVPSFISGVLSLRGIIIPVFDMHERLGLEGNSRTGKERIIVVKKGDEFCGVLVDEVIQVVRILESTIEQPPAVLEGIDRDLVLGIGRYDKRMLILLNLNTTLDLTLC